MAQMLKKLGHIGMNVHAWMVMNLWGSPLGSPLLSDVISACDKLKLWLIAQLSHKVLINNWCFTATDTDRTFTDILLQATEYR